MSATKIRYDYYRVAIIGDTRNGLDELTSHAIDIARGRARLRCDNCTWTAEKVHGDPGDPEVIFRVCRTRPQT